MTFYVRLPTSKFVSKISSNKFSKKLKINTIQLPAIESTEPFQAIKNISLWANNNFSDGELPQSSVVKESLTVQHEGKWQVKHKIVQYTQTKKRG